MIPTFPDCEIQLVAAENNDGSVPDLVLQYTSIQKVVSIEGIVNPMGEIWYEWICSSILYGDYPFYMKGFTENGRDIVRIIVSLESFYKVIRNNPYFIESSLEVMTNDSTGIPTWCAHVDWYKCSKPTRACTEVDANKELSRDTQETQEGSKQQRCVSVDPPSRERDAVYWYE